MNCVQLENCLHEAREEVRTNKCSADRRAVEYDALRSSALRIHGLFERLNNCVTAPGMSGFADSLRALALSLARYLTALIRLNSCVVSSAFHLQTTHPQVRCAVGLDPCQVYGTDKINKKNRIEGTSKICCILVQHIQVISDLWVGSQWDRQNKQQNRIHGSFQEVCPDFLYLGSLLRFREALDVILARRFCIICSKQS